MLTGLKFNRERKSSRREPSFVPPESTGVSYANVYTGNEVGHDEERYNSEPKVMEEPSQMAYDPPRTSGYGYDNQPAQIPAMEHRASMDAYAAGGAGDRTSRTMQLAYNDPCKFESPGVSLKLTSRCCNPCKSDDRSLRIPSPARGPLRTTASHILAGTCYICFA
jgi:hypothetical protein